MNKVYSITVSYVWLICANIISGFMKNYKLIIFICLRVGKYVCVCAFSNYVERTKEREKDNWSIYLYMYALQCKKIIFPGKRIKKFQNFQFTRLFF
jgi:hypothetical protein